MLPAHLRHRHLNSLDDLTRRTMRTVRAVGQPGELPAEIPRHPPVHCRPVHTDPGGYFDLLVYVATAATTAINHQPMEISRSRCRASAHGVSAAHDDATGRSTGSVAMLHCDLCRFDGLTCVLGSIRSCSTRTISTVVSVAR